MLILYGSTRGAFDPNSQQRSANWPGDVPRALAQLTTEVLVLYALLRPRSYAASWKRSLAAVLLFAAWVVIGGAPTIHTGRTYNYHWAWLVLMTLALCATLLVSASVAIRHRAPAT